MKTLSNGLLELALSKAKKIGKTVFINRTAYSNAEYLVRKFVPEDFDFDVFHTVLYIDYSTRFKVFELSSADPDFTIKLIDAAPEGNGIFDCEYLINDTQTVHLWHDDFYLVGIESEKRDNPPADYGKQILEIDTFGPFAQNLHLYYDRWEIWRIIFLAGYDLPSGNILIDTPECKAYGHMEGHELYVTTASKRFVMPEDMSYAFYGLTRLTEIWGLENVDTSQVKSMCGMFMGCALNAPDLSSFGTSNVVRMDNMFRASGKWTSNDDHYILDISNFSIENVKDMDSMFMDADYRIVRIGNWNLDKFDEDTCFVLGELPPYVILDLRLMSNVNLLTFIRQACPKKLLCNEAQKELLSHGAAKDIKEKYHVELVEKPVWYDMDRQKTIFVQDDIIANTLLYKIQWEKSGYKVVYCNDITKAYNTILECKPDLIFCDILEPNDANGIEFCSFLKNDEQTKNIPFCFLTSLNDHNSLIKGIEAGANGYVTKPTTPYDMNAYIPKLMRCTNKVYMPRKDNPWSIYREFPRDRRCAANYHCGNIREALLMIEQEDPETWERRIWQMLEAFGYFTEEMLKEDGKPLPLTAPYIEFTINNERLYNTFKKVVSLYIYLWNQKH